MLYQYIRHSLEGSAGCQRLSQEMTTDALSEVKRQTQVWLFDDGVCLRCTEEIEYITQDVHQSYTTGCPERWIVWEVIEAKNKPIIPLKKEFFSLCQQKYWLKMQHATSNKSIDSQ